MHLNMNKYADDATFIFFFNFSKTKYFLHEGNMKVCDGNFEFENTQRT